MHVSERSSGTRQTDVELMLGQGGVLVSQRQRALALGYEGLDARLDLVGLFADATAFLGLEAANRAKHACNRALATQIGRPHLGQSLARAGGRYLVARLRFEFGEIGPLGAHPDAAPIRRRTAWPR